MNTVKMDTASKLIFSEVDDLARQHIVRTLKRCLSVFVVLFTVIVLVSERQRLLQVVDHPIEKMTVQGSFLHINDSVIKDHASRYINVGFLSVNLTDVKQHIEALPWVFNAQVSRVWPGEINIFIEEQVPVSYWNDDGLINAEGQFFQPAGLDQGLALPSLKFEGAAVEQDRLSMFSLLEYMQNELSIYQLEILSLQQNLRGAWEIKLKNDVGITLGQLDINSIDRAFLDDKLERVGRLFLGKNDIDLSKIERLDTRYPNGIAVQWKDNVSDVQ